MSRTGVCTRGCLTPALQKWCSLKDAGERHTGETHRRTGGWVSRLLTGCFNSVTFIHASSDTVPYFAPCLKPVTRIAHSKDLLYEITNIVSVSLLWDEVRCDGGEKPTVLTWKATTGGRSAIRLRSCAFSDLINWAGLFQGVISNDPTHKIKKTSGCDEVEQVACVLCSFASVLSANERRLFLSVQCVSVSSSPGRLWQTLSWVQTESAAVTWCLLLSTLTAGSFTDYCCVEACGGEFSSTIIM